MEWHNFAEVGNKLKIFLASVAILPCNGSMSDADRLTKLEERYVHLQRHIAEQDKAMLELSEMIGKLRNEIAVLRAQATGGRTETRDPGEERPPHY